MLNQNHPDDERLSSLASRDADATADATLTAHVSSCDRCTELVSELGALRVALADLPDLRPSRPLQLLPPVTPERERSADRLGGWARRFFGPALAAGAALALVGTVGTAAPVFEGMASSPTAGGADSGAVQEFAAPEASDAAAGEEPNAAGTEDSYAPGGAPASSSQVDRSVAGAGDDGAQSVGVDEDLARESLTTERSPWPMVLFAGVALMIAAAVVRWILVPRAA